MSRTGIGAIGDRDPEFMVHFEGPLNPPLEKILQLSAGEGFFQIRGERLANNGTIGATARAETRFDLISFDLLLHVLEETLLTGTHMLQGHRFCAAAAGLLLHALPDALSHEKGDTGDGLLCLVSPIHNRPPPDGMVQILH